jgi:flavin-dependent dehydrogenase
VAATSPQLESEICVLGGGPAGTVIAGRLAELGHDTVLIDRTARAGQVRSESLAPSILPILKSLELDGIVDAAVFLRETRALLLWESGTVREKAFDAAPSLLVERTPLDELLRGAARNNGVRLIAPAAARSPQRLATGGWIVPVATPNGATALKARFLVDARGKRRRAWSDDRAPRTAAVSAAWMFDRSFRQTRIEAGADEWYWGSALPDGGYSATIFLDAIRIAGLTTQARTDLYRSLLARSTLFGALLGGKMASPAWVRDATSGISESLIGSDFIRIGDAAVAIDPLSSQGLQAAMLSAIQGSAAVHTLLTADCDGLPAIEFYRERRQTAFRQARSNAARLYGETWRRSSFWLRRSSPRANAHPVAQQTPHNAIPWSCRLGVSHALRIVEVPVLADTLIARAPALSHPSFDHPIAYRGGIALAPLIREIGEPLTPDQIVRRWGWRMPAKAAIDIMRWMCAAGILVPKAGDGARRLASGAP